MTPKTLLSGLESVKARHGAHPEFYAERGEILESMLRLSVKEAAIFEYSEAPSSEHARLGKELYLAGMLAAPYPCVWIMGDAERPALLYSDLPGANYSFITQMCTTENNAVVPGHITVIPKDGSECIVDAVHGTTERYLRGLGDEAGELACTAMNFVFGAFAMLLSKEVQDVATPPNAKINAYRERRNKPPLPWKHTISIREESRAAYTSQGGTHASPRMHWRRGHLRHYHSGKVSIIPPMIINAVPGYKALLPDYEVYA